MSGQLRFVLSLSLSLAFVEQGQVVRAKLDRLKTRAAMAEHALGRSGRQRVVVANKREEAAGK